MGTVPSVEQWGLSPCRAAVVVLLTASMAAGQQPKPQEAPVFRGGTELVLVNVVARDKSGAFVRGLTRDDFVVLEDGKPQSIERAEFEQLDRLPVERSETPPAAQSAAAPRANEVSAPPARAASAPLGASAPSYQDRRL